MVLEKLEEELESTELVKKEEVEEAKKGPPKEIYQKVVRFTNEIRKQYGEYIKSVLIFGSAARGEMRDGSDADVWVVLDDTATKGTEDLNRITAHLHLLAQQIKNLHIQATPLTEFWQWVKLGSPELVNFLRYGLPIYDTGFIKPVQRMLNMGLIPPSEEAIGLKARVAESRLKRAELDMRALIFDLRYSVLDICQAVIMHYYKYQPDAKAIPSYLEKLVKEKGLEPEFVAKFKELDKLWKDIDHKRIERVTTEHLQRALGLASEIMERFKKLLPEEMLGEGEK